MTDYETLEITRDGSVMTIALNRPEKMNTFNTALDARLLEQRSRLISISQSVRSS